MLRSLHGKTNRIPENPDSMFVSDCFWEATTVNSKMIRTFRIFFTTKRILSFAKYVRKFFCLSVYNIANLLVFNVNRMKD